MPLAAETIGIKTRDALSSSPGFSLSAPFACSCEQYVTWLFACSCEQTLLPTLCLSPYWVTIIMWAFRGHRFLQFSVASDLKASGHSSTAPRAYTLALLPTQQQERRFHLLHGDTAEIKRSAAKLIILFSNWRKEFLCTKSSTDRMLFLRWSLEHQRS